MNTAKTIIIRCGWSPEPIPRPDPLPTFIARYDLRHPGKPTNLRAILEDDAKTLASALVSWRHDTNYFSSRVGERHLSDYRRAWELLLMAGKRKTYQATEKAPWQGFLESPLHDDQLAECDAWKPKATELFEFVHAMMESGIEVALTYQANTKSATATLKDQRPESKTRGYALSARDENGLAALKLAVWKHQKVLMGDWSVLLPVGDKKVKRG